MDSPFFSSSFCALMTGGRNAPSDGAPKITIESFASSSADAEDNDATVISTPIASPNLFLTVASIPLPFSRRFLPSLYSLPRPEARCVISPRRAADRLLELLAQRHEEASDQMFRDAGEDALADAGDEAADLASALVDQLGSILAVRLDLEARGAVAMAECAGAGNLDAAGPRRILVRQRDLAFEGAADRGHLKLHVDLVGIGRDLGHALAAGNAARQHLGIVERNPQRLDGRRDGFIAADIELHDNTSQTEQFLHDA